MQDSFQGNAGPAAVSLTSRVAGRPLEPWGRRDDDRAWAAGSPSWSPLLMLGASVVAAVMLIGTTLSMLGTEPEAPEGSRAGGLVQRLAAQHEGSAVAVVAVAAVAEFQTLQAGTAGSR